MKIAYQYDPKTKVLTGWIEVQENEGGSYTLPENTTWNAPPEPNYRVVLQSHGGWLETGGPPEEQEESLSRMDILEQAMLEIADMNLQLKERIDKV
ncbi:hypothetical protein [Alkalicoccobacillus plakortidis]|uniref:YD repeat-containing protein n=1 Tax=Alkalicoccobacillus plakortidis TaxID=444060 RepID=A0ABT0XIL7_9BACI|nr:hypothetical protein [Alkalicoccobacillus plakortidis]MCM2675565.1 hypothetical protein [Alkalicoccobacillus plakortidis]